MKRSGFDLVSIEIIVIICIFSALRFSELPQWIDGYYHLSAANGFIKSGGWSGWAWWDFAPSGRAHLYPPLYHLLLVFLMKTGASGLNAVRITEVLILPAFFLSLWAVLRRLAGDRFSFFMLLTLSSFFAFYSSVSVNFPASLAVIFGLLCWLYIKKKKFLSAALFLGLSFYTHAGIPWIFCISLAALAISAGGYRKLSLKIVSAALLLASPLLYHQFKHIKYFTLTGDPPFTYISIFIAALGLAGLFLTFGDRSYMTNYTPGVKSTSTQLHPWGVIGREETCPRNDWQFLIPLFWGFLAGSIAVFIKYPYRFFSAQGMIAPALFSSLLLEKIIPRLGRRTAKIFMILVISFLLLSHATINFDEAKLRFNGFDSTFYNFLTGRVYRLVNFRAFFIGQFLPIAEVIEKNSSEQDIISSNYSIISQVFSAITRRPPSNSMFQEVKPKTKLSQYENAKLIVWANLPKKDAYELPEEHWKMLYADGFACVYLNPAYTPSLRIVKSKVSFRIICFMLLAVLLVFLKDNKIRVKKST